MSDVPRADVDLYRGLEPVLGPDVATMLIERLPPPPDVLVSQADLERSHGLLTTEINGVRSDLTTEIGRVRSDLTTEIGRVRSDLTTEIGRVRSDLTTEIDRVRSDLTTEIDRVRSDLTTEIDHLGASLETSMHTLRFELLAAFRGELTGAITQQTRTLLLGLVGTLVSLTGMTAAFAQLF